MGKSFSQKLIWIGLLWCMFVTSPKLTTAQTVTGLHDTLVLPAVIFEGDTLEARVLPGIYVYGFVHFTGKKAAWTRLRNAVYVTYPYAKRAGVVFNDINAHLTTLPAGDAKAYIKSRESELKKEFANPLTQLSIYQGKVLMKLINRETQNNCYDIIKEYKGGFTARFWQTIAFVFGSNLKQSYDAKGEDAEIESIVREVERMYGYRS